MCLPRLRPAVAAPWLHGRLRTNRDRCACLSPGDSPTAVPADLHLPGRPYPHGSTSPKLIPKGRYGISVWVEILLDKYFSYRPTERLLGSWRLLGLDLAPGTVTDGLRRLEILLRPIYQAFKSGIRKGTCIKPMRHGGRCSSSRRARKDMAGGYGSFWVRTRWSSAGSQSRSHGPREPLSGPSRVGCWWSIAIRLTRR